MCLAIAVAGGRWDDRRRGLFRLVDLRPRRFLGARGHPGIVFGRATPRRYAGRLAAHPVRHVGEMLTRGFAGAGRQRNAGKTQQHPFETRRGTIHHGQMSTHCGDCGAQSWRRCGEGKRRSQSDSSRAGGPQRPWKSDEKRGTRLVFNGRGCPRTGSSRNLNPAASDRRHVCGQIHCATAAPRSPPSRDDPSGARTGCLRDRREERARPRLSRRHCVGKRRRGASL
jgi:hypothetical protein